MRCVRWWIEAVAVVVTCATAASGASMPGHPAELAVGAGRSLVIGNAARAATIAGEPAPVGSGGTVLLDERVHVGDVWARTGAKTRLLSQVSGTLLVCDGIADLGTNGRVTGDVVARAGVVVSLGSVVDGGVVATAGGVRLARLSRVAGDVYARTEFRADRDVVVGTPGTTVEIAGSGTIRDRGEYFATILHEGPLAFLGVGDPILHAPVVQMGSGTLAAPSLPDFRLTRPDLPIGTAGGTDVVAGRDGVPVVIPPGRYRQLRLEQDGVAVLAAGSYAFESISGQSGARLVVELGPAPATLSVVVRGNAAFGRRLRVDLGGVGRFDAASRIVLRTGGDLRIDQDGAWVGTLQGGRSLRLGKDVDLTGAAWSPGEVAIGRDSTVTWVPALFAW